jgi:hypothetical protein
VTSRDGASAGAVELDSDEAGRLGDRLRPGAAMIHEVVRYEGEREPATPGGSSGLPDRLSHRRDGPPAALHGGHPVRCPSGDGIDNLTGGSALFALLSCARIRQEVADGDG